MGEPFDVHRDASIVRGLVDKAHDDFAEDQYNNDANKLSCVLSQHNNEEVKAILAEMTKSNGLLSSYPNILKIDHKIATDPEAITGVKFQPSFRFNGGNMFVYGNIDRERFPKGDCK